MFLLATSPALLAPSRPLPPHVQSDLVIGSNGACGKGANPRERLLPREGKKDPKRVKEATEGAEEEDEETMEKGE